MQFYFLLNTVMLSRLIFGFKDKAAGWKRLLAAFIIQTSALFILRISAAVIILMFVILVLNIAVYYLERKIKNINASRVFTFAVYFLIIGIFTSSSINIELNEKILSYIAGTGNYLSFIGLPGKINWSDLNIITAALLFLINESNFIIRVVFEMLGLAPLHKISESVSEIDSQEYNAGRIIGMLERILIFIFLMADQYAAIGFIIAAKGFTRFKELDNKNFAEYVLIGTFLSALIAISVALLTNKILNY